MIGFVLTRPVAYCAPTGNVIIEVAFMGISVDESVVVDATPDQSTAAVNQPERPGVLGPTLSDWDLQSSPLLVDQECFDGWLSLQELECEFQRVLGISAQTLIDPEKRPELLRQFQLLRPR